MGRQKRPKKKKSLEPAVFTVEEQTAALSILQALKDADPGEIAAQIPDSRQAQAVIERVCLDTAPSIPILLCIKRSFDDKQVQKAIKKAFFRLKQRGIPVEEFSEQAPAPSPILKPVQEEKPAAFVGPVLNMFGSRAVMITHHKATKLHMGMGLASDEDGIHDFVYGTLSKKRIREMKKHLSEQAGPLVETSLSHAATILEHAYERHVAKHADAPRQYLELRPWLHENAPVLEHPVIYDFVSGAQAENKILTGSQLERLFQHHLMETWLIEFDRLKPFMEELLKAEDSHIVLTDAQKSDQARRIKENCMKELFTKPERALLRQRLEEMAFVFFRLQEEDFYRLCLDAAQTLDARENLLKTNPVVEFILERSLDFYIKLVPGKTPGDKGTVDEPASSIILP